MGWIELITVDLFWVYSSVAFPGAGELDARVISDTAHGWRLAPPKMPWLSTFCKCFQIILIKTSGQLIHLYFHCCLVVLPPEAQWHCQLGWKGGLWNAFVNTIVLKELILDCISELFISLSSSSVVRREAQISKYFQKKLNWNWYECKIFCIDKTMPFHKNTLRSCTSWSEFS